MVVMENVWCLQQVLALASAAFNDLIQCEEFLEESGGIMVTTTTGNDFLICFQVGKTSQFAAKCCVILACQAGAH